MNHHPNNPGNIPAFSELKKIDNRYFVDNNDPLPLSDTDRLLFLSHFEAIGKMWEELSRLHQKKIEQFKQKYAIYDEEEPEAGLFYFYLILDGEKRYLIIDTLGCVDDTDIPKSKNDDELSYPQVAEDIASELCAIFQDIELRMKSLCRCLGYEFKWDEWSFNLIGNGIKTRGYAWSDDCDPLFDNIVYFREVFA